MKNLHHIARAGFSLLVALTLALPGVGFSAAANQAWADVQQRAVNDPVPTTLEEAKTNLDLANALKSTAAEEEAKAKAALDAAKVTHETATNEHATNASMLDQATTQANEKLAEIVANAQAQYDELSAKVDEYQQDLANAQAKKAAAEAVRDEKEAAYNQAQAEFDAKVAAITTEGSAEVQAAYTALKEAENAYEQATTIYKDAANEYKVADSERKDAIAAWNTAKSKVTQCEEAVAAAQAKVNAAQAALDAARSNLSTAADDEQKAALQAALTDAQNKLNAAQSEKTAAEGRLATAKSEQTAAEQAVTAAEKALEDAKANSGNTNIDALKKAVDDAQKKYDDAKAAYDAGAKDAGVEKPFQQALNEKIAAENALKEADDLVTSTLKNLNDAKEELAAISAGDGGNQQKVLSLKAFFDEQDSTAASDLFNTMGDASFTQQGSPGDATDPEFVERSLDLIENLNLFRTSKDLPEFRVTDVQMAYLAISLNFATGMHLGPNYLSSPRELFVYSEADSSWSTMGSYSLCDGQRELWNAALSTNTFNSYGTEIALPEGWSTMTPDQLAEECWEFFSEVALYANAIAPTNIYVGTAADHSAESGYGFGVGFSETSEGQSYTLAEWKTRFQIWVDAKKAAAANISTAATEAEIASAQQKVDDAQDAYNKAVEDQAKKAEAAVTARTQYEAAESIKGLEDAMNDASSELAAATQAHEAAVNNAVDFDDPNHPLNLAITTAKANLETKKQEVANAQAAVTTAEANVSSAQSTFNNAKTALEEYTAADTSALQAALDSAKRDLERAQADLEAALAAKVELDQKVAALNNKCRELVEKQTTIRTTQLTPAKTASDAAKRAYDNALKTTTENSEYREMLKMKNALDKQREEFTDTLYAIADQQANMTTAQRQLNETTPQLTTAETKLAAAKQLSIEGIINNPLGSGDFSEFLVLNDHAQNVKDAQTVAQPTLNRVNAAKSDLDAAQAAYDAARAKHVSATADRDEAQRIYDSFLAVNDPSNPSTPSNPTNPSEPSGDPVVEPWNPGSPSGAASGSNKNAGSSAGNANEGSAADESVAEEATAEESTGAVKNAPYVAKPKTVAAQGSIVGPLIIAVIIGAFLIAVGAAILMAVRRRHTAAVAAATTAAADTAVTPEAEPSADE